MRLDVCHPIKCQKSSACGNYIYKKHYIEEKHVSTSLQTQKQATFSKLYLHFVYIFSIISWFVCKIERLNLLKLKIDCRIARFKSGFF